MNAFYLKIDFPAITTFSDKNTERRLVCKQAAFPQIYYSINFL